MRSAAYRPTSTDPCSRQALRAMNTPRVPPTTITEEPTMRKLIDFTLNNAALTPLREACYSRMLEHAEQLHDVLELGMRQSSRDAWAAFTRLQCTGNLLNRIGWTDDDDRNQVKLTGHLEVELAISVLRDEAGTESAVRGAALEDNATEEADRATKRELAIHNILTGLEAALAANSVARAAACAAEPPIA